MGTRSARRRIAVVLAGGVLCAPGTATAGTAVTLSAQAEVLEQIQFAVLLDMDFGKVAVGGAGGTVMLDPASSSRTCDPVLTCVGGFAMSRLQLTGSEANVVVSFAPNFVLEGPGQPILAEPQFPGGSGAVIHLTGGQATVNFGARLHINPGQTPGVYAGQFSVDLEYN